MKTQWAAANFKTVASRCRLMLLGLAIAAAFTARPVSADIMSLEIMPIEYTLTLTELSSTTNLMVTYTGPGGNGSFMASPTGTDSWTIQVLSSTVMLNPIFIYDFAEPENTLEVNEVQHDGMTSPDIFVRSDLPFSEDNEYTGFTTIPVTIGSDGGVPIKLVFVDQAATAEGVPDTGSSLALLALSLAGLVGLRRLRFPQLA